MESEPKINPSETPPKKLIFDSLTDGWDKDYTQNEIPPYLKEIRLAVIGNVDSGKSTLLPNPQSPIPNPQSPIPISSIIFFNKK